MIVVGHEAIAQDIYGIFICAFLGALKKSGIVPVIEENCAFLAAAIIDMIVCVG